MRQRGRRSGSNLISIVGARRMPPRPPAELSPDQASVWRDMVSSLPDRWVEPPAFPILVQFCRHVVQARRLAEMLERATADPDWTIADYDRLLRIQQRETAAIAACGRALRLNPQQQIWPRGAGRRMTGEVPAGRRRPWEFGE
jgi:hypothetical protein